MQTNQVRQNILFYSQKCQTSANLIKMLNHENLLKYFKMICIDGQEDKLPKAITHVPALIVQDAPKPFLGDETFKWLESIKFRKYQELQEKNRKLFMYNMQKNQETNNGAKAFITSELTGFSDNYAYQDENNNNAQPKSFVNWNDDPVNNAIYTAPLDKKKVTSKEQSQLMKEEENRREKQETEFNNINKQRQAEEVIKYEREKIMSQYKKI
jgi:hypothetical protein